MVSMSSLDLMGRTRVVSFSWEGLQAYPLKFMFSDMMGLLRVRLHVGVTASRCSCVHRALKVTSILAMGGGGKAASRTQLSVVTSRS